MSALNPAQLLRHFDRISEAPDAVQRLRRFILDLAVRGKLVEQDPSDEPASELLKRIQVQKADLAKEGKLRGDTSVSPIDEKAWPRKIPVGWTWVSFGEVMISRDGERIPVSKEERSGRAKQYDYYGASGVIDKIDGYLFDKPLLLIGEDGANLINRSTPIAFMARGKYWVNNHAHVLDGFSEGFLQFVALHINAIDLKPYVTGTAQPKMNQAKMNSIPIALPPLAEQHRIVAKVDELMALCDQLEATQAKRESRRDRLVAGSLHRLSTPSDADEGNTQDAFRDHARFIFSQLPRLTTRPAHIKQLRQTILNLAVRGNLVAQDANDEPAAELLKRIQTEKARLVKAGRLKNGPQKTSSKPSDFSFKLAAGWAPATLQELCITVTDGDHQPPPKAENGVPFLVIGNVRTKSIIFDGCRFVPEEYYNSLDPIRRPQKGDILFTLVGSYGIPIAVTDNHRFCVQRHIGILRPSPEMDVHFLARVLESKWVFDQALACATGIAQQTVPLAGLRRVTIPLPPLAEQRRIVAKVDELMALCDQLESQLTTNEADSRRLLEAVLQEALSTPSS